jgi:two-component system sensor histidine kinase KdpD
LKRNPAVALVDELAHTNVPGSHNKKRYQDVLELLDAGINVIAALNVQHLDSLNDLVGRVTGVVVRETVPDSFLKRADQVVNLDLAVEDLQERLRTGKIYAADKVPRSPRAWSAAASPVRRWLSRASEQPPPTAA